MSDLGGLIASRGVKLDLDPGDLVSDIVIIAEVITDHGPTIALGTSDGTSWIKQLGMITAADSICRQFGEDNE